MEGLVSFVSELVVVEGEVLKGGLDLFWEATRLEPGVLAKYEPRCQRAGCSIGSIDHVLESDPGH